MHKEFKECETLCLRFGPPTEAFCDERLEEDRQVDPLAGLLGNIAGAAVLGRRGREDLDEGVQRGLLRGGLRLPGHLREEPQDGGLGHLAGRGGDGLGGLLADAPVLVPQPLGEGLRQDGGVKPAWGLRGRALCVVLDGGVGGEVGHARAVLAL